MPEENSLDFRKLKISIWCAKVTQDSVGTYCLNQHLKHLKVYRLSLLVIVEDAAINSEMSYEFGSI